MIDRRGAAVRAALFISALGITALTGCGSATPSIGDEAPAFLASWFAQAEAGARDDTLCHGLGTLKHPEISCREMLEHAARVVPDSREISEVRPLDCFGDVCGEFVEVRLRSIDQAGSAVDETAVIKRDEGTLRLYWYRSDSLMASLRQRFPEPDELAKDPLQAAYDEITGRYPTLYQYPPCLDVRPSSANLVGELVARDQIDVGFDTAQGGLD